MAANRFQHQRFELKYLVTEERALALRRFVSCHLKPDDFAASLPNYSYPVHSLYLDSPQLTTYQAVQTGEKNRFKLRVRHYTANDAAVHFEIKRRTNEIISKLRATVHRASVQPLLAGRPPALSDLVKPDGRQLGALQEFCRLMHTLRATPRSHVAYQREAWMSPIGNSLRITFDRDVLCEPEFGAALDGQFSQPMRVFDGQVVFELKFTDRLPSWCGEMIRLYNLVRGGAPKYAQGVLLLGEHRVSNHGVGLKIDATSAAATPAPRARATVASRAAVFAA
ncbi:MAG: polyphosphate polymerase domain-containing protein [Opitutaceae bacterium]|nr:polyphosphate polymerase domain-containing protein [Opitutaceae bacterium]